MLDLAGVKPLSELNGKPTWGIQGKSLVESFASDKNIERPFLFFEHSGHEALRNDDWKIVHKKGGPWELYNIRGDRAENTNVAKEYPETLQQMIQAFKTFQNKGTRMNQGLPPENK